MYNFPDAPTTNQQVNNGGASYYYDGVKWVSGMAPVNTITSFNGRVGAVTLTPADLTGASGFLATGGTISGTTTITGNLTVSTSFTLSAAQITGPQFQTGNVTGAANYLLITGGTSTNPATLAAAGSAANLSLPLTPKGTGNVQVTANPLLLAADPTALLHAATKNYVDSRPIAVATVPTYIQNGMFSVAQRGQGPWTTSVTTIDRWRLNVVTDTVSVTQFALADADRTAIGDETARYGFQNVFTGNAAAGAFNEVMQQVEFVNRLSGKTVTISFWARRTAGTAAAVGVNASQNFGTGGSPSATVNVLTTGINIPITASWARYSATIALPTISGKVLGTNLNDHTQIRIGFSSGATFNAFFGNIGVQSGTVQIWGVQVQDGGAAGPFWKADPSIDLLQCQRYYQTGVAGLLGYFATTSGYAMGAYFSLPVPMRTTPIYVFFQNAGSSGGNGSILSSTPSPQAVFQFLVAATAVGTGNVYGTFTATADNF
jgi:hypothetical protein